ncbi:integrase, catalytic region, zinc finger, CCHC-type containing protein [Tanacetum coccineum]
MTIAGAKETVGSPVVKQSGIQCFNCKEFGHFAKERRKPKRVKDYTYHKEKMLLCKQAEKGVPLQAEQYDWLADTDEEIDEQELEAHYSYIAKIQEVPTADLGTNSEPLEHVQYDTGYIVFANRIQHSKQSESISNTRVVETDDNNVIPDSPDMCDNDISNDQNDVVCDDERVVLANSIANLKLDFDENKKIQKQLKKENTTLADELTKCKSILAETSRSLEESNSGQVVQQSGIQCFNCKEFGHFAKECRKPKRVKDSTYHKEKMLLCKQAEKGVQLQAEQSDWLADTDEEIDEQELEAHYSYMAKIQEVPNADSGTDSEPLEQVQYDTGYNVFANEIQHSEQSESISNTCVVETVDSNVIPDSPDMCDNDIQNDQNAVECDDERVALANLIANLKLDVDENKKIQKQLKKANTSLTQELKECKSTLAETSRTLGESNSIRDSCLVALQNKQTEFERYKAFNDRTVDYDKLKRKLNETLGLLAQKDIDIKEGLKVKAYEISVVKEKHDELVKQSLLTKSHYEGLVKEKTKVITDLKLKEEKDIDKMISMENQLKFLNEIVYKRSQSIQTIHMLAPKCPTFNGRPTFANPMYLKMAQYEKPSFYEIPHDQSDLANRLVPDREETLTLKRESREKLNKYLVKPYDYRKLNSFYEIFKPPTQEYQIQLAHTNEVRKKMWRKCFVKTKPNIFKNIDFLPVSKSISKSRQAYNVMTNNINHLRELVDQAWVKHSRDHFRAPTAKDMEILIKTCLMPLALKTQNDSFAFVHELKKEMHADLKYVESLENKINELESDKAEFSNMYDKLLQECVSNDVILQKKASNVFQKEREQYFEIQDLKAQLQDKNIAISEIKKLIEKCKGKSVETKFDKPYVVRQPNAQRIPKPSVLGKPAPFSDSLERKSFSQTKSVPKTNVSESLSKPVTT